MLTYQIEGSSGLSNGYLRKKLEFTELNGTKCTKIVPTNKLG